MKRIFNLVLAGMFFIILFNGCEKKYIDLTPPETASNDSISFSKDIVPIFNSKCVGCHGTGGQTPILVASVAYQNLTTGNFVNTSNPAASLMYVEITAAQMGNCTQAETDKILTWIQNGSPNN